MTDDRIRSQLERAVPSFAGDPAEWDDVLARAKTRPARVIRSRRIGGIVLAGAVAAVLFVPSFGLGGRLVELVAGDDRRLGLPRQADSSRALVVLEPRSGDVVVVAAPMRRRDGICYLFRDEWSGCALRSRRGSLIHRSRFPSGYTFDRRAVSAELRLPSRRGVRLTFHRLPDPVNAAFFFDRRASGPAATALLLRDRAGTVIRRIPLNLPTPPPAAK